MPESKILSDNADRKIINGFFKGSLLVSTPDILDPRFSRSVIYLISHNEKGAMGFIINKPIDDIQLSDIIETEKNKSSDTNFKKKEVIETKKKTSNTNRLDKNEKHRKISRYSLSSIKVQRSLKEIKKIKNDGHDLAAEEKFKLEDLKVVIQEYIEQLKKEGKRNLISILNMNPVKLDNNNVVFTVANELNRVEINLEKEKLLSFICNKLNNFKIAVKVNISEIEKEKIIFTQKEKYQHLLKINPSIETLRKKFDLEY